MNRAILLTGTSALLLGASGGCGSGVEGGGIDFSSAGASTSAEPGDPSTTGRPPSGDGEPADASSGSERPADTGTSSGSDTDPDADPDIRLDLGPIPDVGLPDGLDCSETVIARIRDLASDHPDINMTGDPNCSVAKLGLVEPTLGVDGNPVFASNGPGPQISSAASFAQWYEDVPGVNIPFEVELPLTAQGDTYIFDSDAFFPIDDMGYGNVAGGHNYYFTTEIHSLFEYQPGQVFTFEGDDDFWLFIEGQLVVDLGGLHCELSETVIMDDWAQPLGLEPGGVYEMAIFHAERAQSQSNFTMQTNIGCLSPTPEG